MTASTPTEGSARDVPARIFIQSGTRMGKTQFMRQLTKKLEEIAKREREDRLQRRNRFYEALAKGGRVVYVSTLDLKGWKLPTDGTSAGGSSESPGG